MKRSYRISRILLVVAAIGTVIWVNAGSLTPPGGPVAPTMKTLVEVEPRVIVNSLPGGGTYKHGITQPGSYYLTDNIISSIPGEIGILVSADNVTIDLRGFALIGAGGAGGGGVALSGLHTNLAVRNGTVRGWGGYGVDGNGASNSQFEALRLFGNIAGGMRSGDVAIVSGSNASQNSGDGISVGTGCTVSNCLAQSNGGVGIKITGNNSRIDENNSGSNTTGIGVTGTGNLIVRNVARLNTTADFSVVAGNDYGQILNSPGANFIATNPWANFAGCAAGQTNCSGTCVNLQNNPNNCGACGTVCPSGVCTSGVCTGCAPGFADCNGNQVDGCEANLNTSTINCGGCGVVCPAVNGTPTCSGGLCGTVCNAGFANCNGNNADGCEINLNTNVTNCGTCGHVCSVANGTPGCTAGTCVVASCNAGFRNCNANPVDGCEVNTNTDKNNCGNCGTVCPGAQNCVAGVCQ